MNKILKIFDWYDIMAILSFIILWCSIIWFSTTKISMAMFVLLGAVHPKYFKEKTKNRFWLITYFILANLNLIVSML